MKNGSRTGLVGFCQVRMAWVESMRRHRVEMGLCWGELRVRFVHTASVPQDCQQSGLCLLLRCAVGHE